MSADSTADANIDAAVTARIQAARGLLQQSRPGEAVPYLIQALTAAPTCAEGYELLGIAYSLTGNRPAARKAFKLATQHGPDRASAHYNYAHFLYAASEIDEAAEENAAALFLSPNHTGAQTLQRNIQQKMRFRDYTADQGFAVATGPTTPTGKFKTLECPICKAPNYPTTRVCEKCNMLMPEMPDLIPVE